MNIKETEKEVGIKKANIRYYEEQGLIVPKRNTINNYRDYSEKDVIVLKKIKTLRLLGISVVEIKELQRKNVSLDEILKKRISTIDAEMVGLKDSEELCRRFQKQGYTYETLDSSFVEMWESLSLQKGDGFMKIDRNSNYESIGETVSKLFTLYVFLIALPTSTNMQEWFHYSVPHWISMAGSIGLVSFGVMNVVAAIYVMCRKDKDKKRAENKFHSSYMGVQRNAARF